MEIIILLICISMIIAIGFLTAFYWTYTTGQYEDTYTPSVRMLFDDNLKKSAEASNASCTDQSTDSNNGGLDDQ